MADASIQVPLPAPVEQLITKICAEKSLPPPDVMARRSLFSVSQESAIEILNAISQSHSIRTFNGYIVHMVRKRNSTAASSSSQSTTIFLSPPLKRSSPSSSASDSPPKCACYCSPNSQKFEASPGSSSKPANNRTIPEYFRCSKNVSASASKQIMSPPCSTSKDAIADNISWQLTDSLYSNRHSSRVQKQLKFSPCSSLKDASPNNMTRHFSDSPNACHHVSHVQEQLLFSPCSSSEDGNCSHVAKHFSDSPIRSGFPIQKQPTFSQCSGSLGATPNNIAPRFSSPTSNHSDSTISLAISQQSLLLKELEFRRLFLVHSYIGRKKLEDVVSVEDAIYIKSMKNVSMLDFEARMWEKYGRQNGVGSDRAMHLDWDSGKTHVYHCYVSADGSYQCKGPYLKTRRTHLQRELGDDNVLIVQFNEDSDPDNNRNWRAAYLRISGGISIGVRHYRLFAFKDGGKGDNKNWKVSARKPRSSWAIKCYFVRNESHTHWEKDPYIVLNKTMHEARCLFMHVHMVSSMAKYISRCSLALSNTTKLRVDLASVLVQRIEDIPCRDENGYVVRDENGEPLWQTDGTGFISEDLAVLCAEHFYEANGKKDNNFEFIDLVKFEEETPGLKGKEACIKEPPLLVQCRLFKDGYAVKGTLLVNKKLKARTIQVRKSMIKVENDPRLTGTHSFSSLEINAISRRPRKTNLSKNLIALLSAGGVPRNYFLNLLESTLQEAQRVSSSMRAAVRVASNYGYMDDSSTSLAMIGVGIPLDEPYLQYRLSILANEERKGLRGGKIPISDSFYLIGTADPTGILNSDEVSIILDNGQINGKVLVYRNPGLHFGDIHVLNAKYVPELDSYVGNAKYGIFFSTKGRRSVASEIANGDFDGDLYWVSQNTQLLHHFKASVPWKRIHSTPSTPNKKPGELSSKELEEEILTRLFTTKNQNLVAGKAADSWQAFVDRYLSLGDDADDKCMIKEKMLKLTDLYYDALDAPKSGKTVELPHDLVAKQFPHYLERKPSLSYHSTSILGEIFDKADGYRPENMSSQDIWRIPCFDVDNVDVPKASLKLWSERYTEYRREITQALGSGDESKSDSADFVFKKYKQMLYGAEDFETSTRKVEDIYNDALAIYNVCYDHAWRVGEVKRCGFAWKVAGSALCSYHNLKTPGKSIPFKLALFSIFA